MFDLAIIIINYKTPYLVTAVLKSLETEINPETMQVIVVDNDSEDGSLDILSHWVQQNLAANWVRLIDAGQNTGFSGGNNIGIHSIQSKQYLLLNSDTVVRSGAIKLLTDGANKDPKVGMVSPRLEWEDATPQESCFRFHTPMSELITSASTSVITKLFSKYVVPQPIVEQPGFYQWTSFACVLIKAEVLEQIGLLDEEFFMYFEDVEFSYRAVRADWKILNIPNAHVVHLRGGSSPLKSQAKLRKRLPRYFYESRTRYFYLLYGYGGLFAANILWSLGAVIALLRSIFSKRYKSNIAEKQWRDIWINFLKPTKQYTHPDSYAKT
jgi:N-acetylglucosaminyl-diphospho-decaprenol L-rhamnosyltransferase